MCKKFRLGLWPQDNNNQGNKGFNFSFFGEQAFSPVVKHIQDILSIFC